MRYLPLYEGKHFHQYNDHWEDRPRYLVGTDALSARPDILALAEHYRLAFRDIAPKSPVHVLVIPKAHYASLEEVPDASVFGAMSMLAQQVARQEGVATRGYRCVVNTGAMFARGATGRGAAIRHRASVRRRALQARLLWGIMCARLIK